MNNVKTIMYACVKAVESKLGVKTKKEKKT